MPTRGQTSVLTVQWVAYAGGPPAAVTGQTITIKLVADGTTVLGPTSTGITSLGTGLGAYPWAVPSDAELGVDVYVALWNAVDDASEAVQASEFLSVVSSSTTVTVDDVVEYIGAANCETWLDPTGTTYPAIEDALAAETRAQLNKCRYPAATDATPNPDLSALHQALKRRVQRNLAMRPLPLSMQPQGDSGLVARPAVTDPEIRRLEGPYRKQAFG